MPRSLSSYFLSPSTVPAIAPKVPTSFRNPAFGGVSSSSFGSSGSTPGSSGSGTASPSCVLPINSRLANVGAVAADGSVLASVDPYFATSAARDTWIAANPTCAAPAWQPDVFTGGNVAPGLSTGEMWGLGIVGAGILGGLALALMPKKSRGSSRRSSR